MGNWHGQAGTLASWLALFVVSLGPVWGCRPEQRGKAYLLGSRLELFLDRTLIDRMDGLDLRLHSPRAAEISITCDRPWEGPNTGYVTVLKDGETFRMYYPSDRGGSGEHSLVPVAESKDGIAWTRPQLGLVGYKGSKQNNLILAADHASNFAPFVDTNVNALPSQRYKAFVGDSEAIFAFASPDGIHWSKLDETPMFTQPPFDSQNVAFWDSAFNQYVAYMRGSVRADGTEVKTSPWFEDFKGGLGLRAIRRSTSKDFLRWTTPELIQFEKGFSEHLYTNAITPYFRAPHFYVGMPMRFVPQRKKIAAHGSSGVSDTIFISSRDGEGWNQTFREALLRPGLDSLNWTDRNLIAASGIVPTRDNEISVYYVENYRHPTNRIRRGVLRVDGFVSVYAPYRGGFFGTRPLMFEGRLLAINYSTSAVGSIRVEIQDENGKPFPGFSLEDCEEIFGDEISHRVSWRKGSDVSSLAGQSVRLRFAMKDADLYSMQFAYE